MLLTSPEKPRINFMVSYQKNHNTIFINLQLQIYEKKPHCISIHGNAPKKTTENYENCNFLYVDGDSQLLCGSIFPGGNDLPLT